MAKEFLLRLGYRILETNATTHWGEIDIVAWDPVDRMTVFVEVKTKSSRRYGIPEEQFHFFKQHKLKRAIEWYMLKQGISDRMRVDLITIETCIGFVLRHYKHVSLGYHDH